MPKTADAGSLGSRNRMKRSISIALACLWLSAAAAPEVLVTTSQLADVARNVAAEHANVTGLMGPGTDPHLYRATPRDVSNLQQADLIIYHGLSLEGQLADVLERFARMRPTAAVAELAVPEELLLASDDEGLAWDPHIWMDAALFSRTAAEIARQLAQLDPANATDYTANAEGYAALLLELHDWIGSAITSIPAETRVLVTAHDAFSYFGRAYGIEVAAVQGLSTEAEAGVADIRGTAELIIEHGVPAIFVESTVNPRTVQAVLEAVHAAGLDTVIGGELYSDAMGPADTFPGTVIGMLVHNTSIITTALGGELPPLPEALHVLAESWLAE